MSVHCPKCGSRRLRFSRTRTTAERLWKIVGVQPLRCRDCHARFVEKTWSFTDLAYARCPKCWRMDLSRWSVDRIPAPAYVLLALKLGAKAYRCEYCRCNFTSLRPRKERFSFHRWKKVESARRAPVERPPLPGQPAAPPASPSDSPSETAEAIAWRKAAEAKRRQAG